MFYESPSSLPQLFESTWALGLSSVAQEPIVMVRKVASCAWCVSWLVTRGIIAEQGSRAAHSGPLSSSLLLLKTSRERTQATASEDKGR